MNESNKSGDSSLHDWFTKSRASDGTPGWVQLGGKYAGKPCAKQPGQTTKPKCGSSKMKRNLDKGEEESAFRRKNREDPNPNRKGKAKNVATEEMNLDEKCWKGYTQKGMKKKGNKTVPNCVPVGEAVSEKDDEYSMIRSQLKGIHNAASRLDKKVGKNKKGGMEAWVQSKITKAADYIDTAADYVTNEAKNIHGDIEVPSGNGGKLKKLASRAAKRIDTDVDGDVEHNDKHKGEYGEFVPTGGDPRKAQGRQFTSLKLKSVKEALEEQNRVQTTGNASDPQTVTYPDGTKQTFVPGSTVIRDVDTKPKPDPRKKFRDTLKSVGSALSSNPLGTTLKAEETEIDEGIRMALVKAIDKTKPGPLSRRGRIRSKLVRSEIEDAAKKNKKRRFSGLAASEKASKADKYMSAASSTTASESFAIDPAAHRKQQRIEKANKLQQGSTGAESQAAGAAVKRLGGSGISLPLANSYQPEGENIEEVAAWQRKAGKNKEGGLNEKGRKSYERENPGSDLKAPSKKVGNPRRKSFCARMSGMKKKLTSSKTANDPNSRINKSLRAWNC